MITIGDLRAWMAEHRGARVVLSAEADGRWSAAVCADVTPPDAPEGMRVLQTLSGAIASNDIDNALDVAVSRLPGG